LLGEAYNPATGNRLWGQQDSVPGQGAYPTTGWAVGEVVTDRYTVTLQADAPPGDYIIEIGLYNATTGERLPVLDDAGNVQDDRLILETVRVIAQSLGYGMQAQACYGFAEADLRPHSACLMPTCQASRHAL